MTRTILCAALVLVAGLNISAVAAAEPRTAGLVRVTVPSTVVADSTLTVEFSLPGGAAAVEGRVLFDARAAEIVGLATVGGGIALRPQELPSGLAFGAYGLRPRGGQTTLRVVLAPLAAGELQVRVVIDAVADARGQRLALGRSSVLAATKVDGAGRRLAAPPDSGRHSPVRAAAAVRDVVPDGALGRMDMDVVRSAWEAGHLNGDPCATIDPAADANGDGCVDIVDLQAVTAGFGTRTGGRLVPTGDTAALTTTTERPSSRRGTLAAVITPTPGNTFVVTSTADAGDANHGDGRCADSQGRCTLRAAVTEANWQRGDNVIQFNLTGTLPVVIQYSNSSGSLVQDRTGGLLIDGYSQPGSRVNTAATGSNAIMGVELRGIQGSRGNIFRVTSANTTIRGISFTRSYRPVVLDGAESQNNLVAGNWFGFTRTGAVDTAYRGNHAVRLDVGANHNQVGTAALADRNVFGNFTHAVDFYGPGTDFNVVQNNLMCATPSGNTTASCSTAVDFNFGPKYNVIGGRGAREGNVIGRTTLNGVEISHGWNPDGADVDDTWHNDHNEVLGNWIGFRGDGRYDAEFRSGQNSPNSNDANGVNVYDGSNFNLVEGNWIGSVWDGINTMSPNSTGNVIRNNIIGESPRGERAPLNRYGINVRTSTKTHFIEGNVIRNTGSHGIALTQKDVLWVRISRNIVTDTGGQAIFLAVDPNNSSRGANNLQPAPVISTATTARVRGTGQNGATVEVFRASRNAGQSGLPVEFLGSAVVGAGGLWEVPVNIAAGATVTALQTSSTNNTSMLSTNVTVARDTSPSGRIAADSFGRSSTDSWGLADEGGAYTTSGPAANYDVGGGVGAILVPAAGNSRFALVAGVSARDVDIVLRVAANKVPAGGQFIVYAVARRSGNSEYRGRLMSSANGTVSVSASVVIDGRETALGSAVTVPGLSPSSGGFIWLRVRVAGANATTLGVRAWADGQTEPGSWHFTAQSSHAAVQRNGAVGIRTWIGTNVSNAPVTFSFDDYAVIPAP